MENLKTKIENIKSTLIELINYLESNSVDATSLKNTYNMFIIIKEKKALEELVVGVSKLLNNTITELQEQTKIITKKKNKTNENIEIYNDSKESEKLINNI